ncbi:hypothetical protein HPB52_020885 [Rhipicephalus sanguineus]|uniref:Uncharacterized protein n=1 Tax=Rhipicephalus sanguineus TaxID=34632 RepID=A0A9D4T035_RHISA|nr:hypothetical protein HPB52_020885 [Rhipicephalus sanguineus]
MSVSMPGSRACGEVAVVEPDVSEVSWTVEVGEDVQMESEGPWAEAVEKTDLSVEWPMAAGTSCTSSRGWSGAGIDALVAGREVGGVVAEEVKSWSREGSGPIGPAPCDGGEICNSRLPGSGRYVCP